MSEIADLTYNVVAFSEIMQMIWKRLNDHGKNWRHVYKSLVLLEYLIKTGSEKVSIHSTLDIQHFLPDKNREVYTDSCNKCFKWPKEVGLQMVQILNGT